MTLNNSDLTKGRKDYFKEATAALKKSYNKNPQKFKKHFPKNLKEMQFKKVLQRYQITHGTITKLEV